MKNGKRTGFVRLNNQDMNESGSEVELLDLTDLNHPNGKPISHKRRRNNDECCCNWCVSFYLLLVTIAFAVLTVFVLFMAWDLKQLRGKFDEMSTEMEKMKSDYNALTAAQKDQSLNHTHIFSSQTKVLENHTHLINALHTQENTISNKLLSIMDSLKDRATEISSLKKATSQLDAKQMERINASMAIVSSFSAEVSGIHTSMAQLGGRMNSLNNEATATKKYCSDFGTKIETMTENLGDVKDSVTVLNTETSKQESFVDSQLTSLSYLISNHTESIKSLNSSFNATQFHWLQTSAQVTSDKISKLEDEVTSMQQSVDQMLDELRNLTVPVPPSSTEAQEISDSNKTSDKDENRSGSKNKEIPSGGSNNIPTGGSGNTTTSGGSNNIPTGGSGNTTTSEGSKNITDSSGGSKNNTGLLGPPGDSVESENITTNSDSTVATDPVPPADYDVTPPTTNEDGMSSNVSDNHNTDYLVMPTYDDLNTTYTGEAPEDIVNNNDSDDHASNTPAEDKVAVLRKFLNVFDDLDKNSDGTITYDEFDAVLPQNKSVFDYLDSDNNGGISRDEILSAIDDISTMSNNDNQDQYTPTDYEH